MAMRGAFIKNTDCTDAHGWVFSRILYSCSAAHRLGFDAQSAQRIDTLSLQKNATQSHKQRNNQGKTMIAKDSFVPLL